MSRYFAVLALLMASLLALPLSPARGDAAANQEMPPDAAASTDLPPSHDALLRKSRSLEFSDTRQAFALATQSAQQAHANHDAAAELAALLQAGKLARFLNDYTESLGVAEMGLALATAAKNESMKGNFYLLRGYVKWNQSDLPSALENLLAAEKISRREHDIPLQIAVESTLGLVDARNDNQASSFAHLTTAYDLAEKTGDPQRASVLNNLGSYYLNQRDYAKGREYYERSLPLARQSGNQRLVAFLLVNLGQVAVETGDYAAANQSLNEALSLSEQYHIRRGTADVHYLRASLERKQGNFDRSRAELDQSLATARDLKNPDLFAIIYAEYLATEEASGHYREALNYAHKLADQKDVIRGEKSRQQVAQLAAQYDAETRSQQIKLLQRDRELDQADLLLKDTELSRTRARYSALALALVVVGLAASAFAGRQRRRARSASLALAETRAAKEQVEEADATKARLLTIAAQHLQDSEARFRNAFEYSPLGIALVDPNGKWIRVNPALCRITGYEEAELLESDFQSITHPDDLPKDLACVAKILHGEIDTYQLEKRYFHKAGHSVWTRLDVSVVRESDTRIPKIFISQVQDITAQKQHEEELRHAKEEAERANSAKSDFLSRMSHELRTPLNAILGFGQLLEIQDLGRNSNQSVSQILTASRHLLELINEVLDISSIESGNFALSLEPVGTHELIRSVVDLILPLAEQANVRITSKATGEGGVEADPRRLKQVLLNLLSNAIKYNKPGGEVIVSCCEAAEKVVIEVSDSGHGIAAKDLESIFVPFSRLPAAQSISGTGLGLSLSKVLTEAMNGRISVQSMPGQGSTFSLDFTLLRGATKWEDAPLEMDPISLSLFEAEISTEATVLYIEDNVTNLELVRQLLAESHNVRLLSALDGASGLKTAAIEMPDLILLDVQLPDLSGLEVLRRLRLVPPLASTPVIVVSADTSSRQMKEMTALGISTYITKPFDLPDLRRAISEALQPCLTS